MASHNASAPNSVSATTLSHSLSDSSDLSTRAGEHARLVRIVERAEGINVPARYKDAKERRERLEREAAEGEERVRRRARRRQSEHKDVQDIYAERDTLLNRFRNRFNSISGFTFEDQQRLEKEQSEYLEAVQAEFQANNDLEEVRRELAVVTTEVHELEGLYGKYIDAQRRLEKLYKDLFTGTTNGYPEEDQAENAERQAHVDKQRIEGDLLRENHARARLVEAVELVKQAHSLLRTAAQSFKVDASDASHLEDGAIESPPPSPSSSPQSFRSIPLRYSTSPPSAHPSSMPLESPRRISFSTSQNSHRSSASSGSVMSFSPVARAARSQQDLVFEVHDLVRQAHLKLDKARNSHPILGVVKRSEVAESGWTMNIMRSNCTDTASEVVMCGLISLRVLLDSINVEIEKSSERTVRLDNSVSEAAANHKQARAALKDVRRDIMDHEHWKILEDGGEKEYVSGDEDALPDYDEEMDDVGSLGYGSPRSTHSSIQEPHYSHQSAPSALEGSHSATRAPPTYYEPSSPPPRNARLGHSHAHADTYHHPTHAFTAPLHPTENIWSSPLHSPTLITAMSHNARRGGEMYATDVVQSPTSMTSTMGTSFTRSPPARPGLLHRDTSSGSGGYGSPESRQSRARVSKKRTSGGIADGIAASLATASLGSAPSTPLPVGEGRDRYGRDVPTGSGLGSSLSVTRRQEVNARSRSPFRFGTRG